MVFFPPKMVPWKKQAEPGIWKASTWPVPGPGLMELSLADLCSRLIQSIIVGFCPSFCSGMTNTRYKSFDCELVSIMVQHEGRKASSDYVPYLKHLGNWDYLTCFYMKCSLVKIRRNSSSVPAGPEKAWVIRCSSRFDS